MNNNSGGKGFNKTLSLIFRLLLGFGLLYFLYRSVKIDVVLKTLSQTDLTFLILGIAAFAVAVVISAATWKVLLVPLDMPIMWLKAVKLRLISFFLNTALPSGIAGDVWRAWVYGKERENSGGSFASVLVEKWVSFVSLALFSLFALAAGYGQFESLGIVKQIVGFNVLISGAVLVSVILFPWFVKGGVAFFKRYGINSPYFIGVKSLDVYGKKPLSVLYSLLISLFSPLMGVLAFWFTAKALGFEIPLLSFFILVPLMRVVNHIPISVNAVGTQDAAMIIFLSPYGISSEEALSMSLLAHGLKIAVTFFGGILYMASPVKIGEVEDKTLTDS